MYVRAERIRGEGYRAVGTDAPLELANEAMWAAFDKVGAEAMGNVYGTEMTVPVTTVIMHGKKWLFFPRRYRVSGVMAKAGPGYEDGRGVSLDLIVEEI